MSTIVSADEAVRSIADGSTVIVVPLPLEEVSPAFARAFEETGSPKDLTIVWSAGIGPFSAERRGLNHFAYPGMSKRFIAGHMGLNHEIVKMIAAEQVECYNLPQGTISQLYREVAAGRPGILTKIGLGTFVDPRVEGGKTNARTRACEDLVEVMTVHGEEYLFYKSFKADVALIRGTTADPSGNITVEDEALSVEILEAALAAHRCGGKVIAQVERVTDTPAHPHSVHVPGILVDYVVVAQSRQAHPHTMFTEHDPSFSGNKRVDVSQELHPLALNTDKVICRRAAQELRVGMVVNLGIGIPMNVAHVACEAEVLDKLTLTTEMGIIGGLPQAGKNFGPAKNPSAFLQAPFMFDFYDGGGLDITFVGMAQADRDGNVNVSRFGPKIIGCGGFINLTQSARKCVFCGEFTAGGFEAEVGGGKLTIRQEGRVRKFIEAVEQITFSGCVARKTGHDVMYITERCVFTLKPEGLVLSEVAPGIDVQRDILAHMDFAPIVPDNVKTMDAAIFSE